MATEVEGKRLVLVDDHEGTRNGVIEFANTYGWVTTAYGDFQSAVEGIQAPSFAADLLLTDHDLGEELTKNGVKIARLTISKHPILPIVLYSTDELLRNYSLEEIAQFGINLFISKNNKADALGVMFEVADKLSQSLRTDRDPSNVLAIVAKRVGIWVAVNKQGKLG